MRFAHISNNKYYLSFSFAISLLFNMNIEVQQYVDSLPSNIRIINVSYKNLIILPDLSRFVDLQELRCNNNKLTSLGILNKNLKHFDCSHNKLISFPKLPENLQDLYCSNNKLTSFPSLNKSLKQFDCSKNSLTLLPRLNENLKRLYCSNNHLNIIPSLNNNLLELYCFNNNLTNFPLINDALLICYCNNNPIFDGINSFNINIIRYNVNKIYNFKHLYYSLKFKNKFRDWLWVRIREPRIRLLYSPANLNILLDNMIDVEDDEEFQTILNNW